eukprot:scaffold74160_cov23-Tisochrysis_lutea.AAC.1
MGHAPRKTRPPTAAAASPYDSEKTYAWRAYASAQGSAAAAVAPRSEGIAKAAATEEEASDIDGPPAPPRILVASASEGRACRKEEGAACVGCFTFVELVVRR